ncbi:hypothetical protein JW949_04560 [Candidatus Woesearchaeota archaeon]|nr:hypothetical protein [Candidatus Woesearchaeota archaeon]
MAEESLLRGTLQFMDKLGVYDVILPFLLVFSIVFAVLEKTALLGYDKTGDEKVTKKNLNAIIAFVCGFVVVASSKLVGVINNVMGNVVLLLLLGICFMLLIGAFHQQTEEGFFLEGGWKTSFIVIMFIGILLIFANALGWLQGLYQYLQTHWDSNAVTSIVLVIVVILFMMYITKDRSKPKKKD